MGSIPVSLTGGRIGAARDPRSAFSLIELLVVTGVMGIVIALSLPATRRGVENFSQSFQDQIPKGCLDY